MKELSQFFSTLTGYIVLVTFVVITGLFTWVFSDTSVFNYNYASLGRLFSIAPLVFLFLIPAVTMQSFATERQNRMSEFLFTKPLRDWEIVGGKYLACVTLVLFSLLPTLLYYFSIYNLGSPRGNIDTGGVIGSYIGLSMLVLVFVAIGMWISSLTDNVIVAFIGSAFLCYILYFGFSFISGLPIFYGRLDDFVQYFGIEYHYDNISRGRIDTRDIVYFLSLTFFFIWLTLLSLEKRKW